VGSDESCSGDCGRVGKDLFSFHRIDQTRATWRCSRFIHGSSHINLTASTLTMTSRSLMKNGNQDEQV